MTPAAAGQAARAFAAPSARLVLEPLGQGLINDTYRVTEGRLRWVLQRINRQVFPDPAAVMANLRRLSDHARQARSGQPDDGWRLPEVIAARDGADGYRDEAGEYWRALTFIDHAVSLPAIARPEQAEQVGRALGWFHGLVATLPVRDFHDTLPGFHVCPGYLQRFDAVLAAREDRADAPGLGSALAFVARRRMRAGILESGRDLGRLVERVIHGDPKLDNVLFDRHSGRAVSLVDLDTVKPGLLHYDLGDCCRSCCNVAGEGADASAAVFDRTTFRAILSGYLREAGASLGADDRDYLYDAIWLLPFELGLRFLTDHLAGDRYFKVRLPGQNLQRALIQFALVDSIEAQERELRALIASLAP